MPLIDSPRLTAEDRRVWAQWWARDRRIAAASAPRLAKQQQAAVQAIERFADDGPCYVSTSWGKDSVIVAHLLAVSSVTGRVPLMWARAQPQEDPECLRVRDAFLARYPQVRYEERIVQWRVPLRPAPGWDDPANDQDILREAFGRDRYISGVRAAESGLRRQAMRWHGKASARSARPIGHWADMDVWLYLALHDLPVHPAYAMTYGGQLDRTRIRVHAIGTRGGEDRDRIPWEDAYYGDVLGLR